MREVVVRVAANRCIQYLLPCLADKEKRGVPIVGRRPHDTRRALPMALPERAATGLLAGRDLTRPRRLRVRTLRSADRTRMIEDGDLGAVTDVPRKQAIRCAIRKQRRSGLERECRNLRAGRV